MRGLIKKVWGLVQKRWEKFIWVDKKSRNHEPSKTDGRALREQNYWFAIALYSIFAIFTGMDLVAFIGKGWLLEFGRIFIAGGLALVVTSIVNYTRNLTIEKNMVEAISGRLKNTVQETFRILQHKIYPAHVYICDEGDDDNLFNKIIESHMQYTPHFKFMSVSGTYLLKTRLMRINMNLDTGIQLLFQNPCDINNLAHRVTQLEQYEGKTVRMLQEEIVESVIWAYILSMKNSSFKIRLRFHEAPPLCRMEFIGSDDLFLSYYKSQVGPRNWGPVAHYKRMQKDMENDVYRSFNSLFNFFWDSNGRKELNFREGVTFNSPHDLIAALKRCLSIDEDNVPEIFSEISVAGFLERMISEHTKIEDSLAVARTNGEFISSVSDWKTVEWLDRGRLLAITNEQNDSFLSPQRFSKTHRDGLWHRVVHIEIKHNNKYFIWLRKDGRYEIPGGHVSWIARWNRAETYEEAAHRELIEELNLPWNWKLIVDDCKERLISGGKILGSPFKNELTSTHGNNKEWVSVYELSWESAWGNPCRGKLSEEGKNANWLSLEEITALYTAGAGLNAALHLFLMRHTTQ